jgi:hypothetical protein
MLCREHGADRRREQHRHAALLVRVPLRDQALKADDIAENLSEEDTRDMQTFNALKKSIRAIPPELIEQTIQLHSKNPEAFENSVSALCAAICDTFKPATATEFVEKLNEDIRSDTELGRSEGRNYAHKVGQMQAAFLTAVAAEN